MRRVFFHVPIAQISPATVPVGALPCPPSLSQDVRRAYEEAKRLDTDRTDQKRRKWMNYHLNSPTCPFFFTKRRLDTPKHMVVVMCTLRALFLLRMSMFDLAVRSQGMGRILTHAIHITTIFVRDAGNWAMKSLIAGSSSSRIAVLKGTRKINAQEPLLPTIPAVMKLSAW